jgi:class 3 adenylate cyclase
MKSFGGTILVVDDDPDIREVLRDRLESLGCRVLVAPSGKEGLELLEKHSPQMVLLDIEMPGMNGLEVLKEIRRREIDVTVVIITAYGTIERAVQAMKEGAYDFIPKPFEPEQIALIAQKAFERERLKREVDILSEGKDTNLFASHRREITVVFLDLRGFTAFSDAAEPEEVLQLLRIYHAEMGKLIFKFEGTLERFTGDGIMTFFNAPIPYEDHTERAVRMAVEMRDRVKELRGGWLKKDYDLDLGIGLATGYAAVGNIGFEGRMDYGAIGNVTNLASRLCGEAKGGQILTNQKTLSRIEGLVEAEPINELRLKGFVRPVSAFNIIELKGQEENV